MDDESTTLASFSQLNDDDINFASLLRIGSEVGNFFRIMFFCCFIQNFYRLWNRAKRKFKHGKFLTIRGLQNN